MAKYNEKTKIVEYAADYEPSAGDSGGGATSNLKQITIRKPELYTGESIYIHLPEDVSDIVNGEARYKQYDNRYAAVGFNSVPASNNATFFCELVLSTYKSFSDNLISLALEPPQSSWPFWKDETTEEDVLNIYYEEYTND